MNRTPCPHCGFQNFEISAYCGRCERPLQRIATDGPTPPPVATAPTTAPTAVNSGRRPTTEPAVIQPNVAPQSTTQPSTGPTPLRRTPPPPPPADSLPPQAGAARPASAWPTSPPPPPPPLPPPAAPSGPAPLVPINLDADSSDLPAAPRVAMPVEVTVASLPRVLAAVAVDALVALAGGAVVLALSLLLGGRWPERHLTLIDSLTSAVHNHPGALGLSAVTVLLVGALSATRGARGEGRTLGRRLTGTVLVRTSGKSSSVLLATIRGFLVIVSALPCFAGFLWVIVDSKHRTLHDVLLGTVIVLRRARS